MLNIKIQINRANWLFLPAFHKAIAFHINSHITAIIINHKKIILTNSVCASILDVNDASNVILIFFKELKA